MDAKQQVNSLLSRSTAYAARIEGEFTPDTLTKAIESYQRNGRTVGILLLCAEHTDALASIGDFANWFDPTDLKVLRDQGRIGTMLGLAVYSEQVVPENERVLRGVSYLFP